MPVFRFCVPQGRPFGKFEFRSASLCFLLFAGQPLTQRRDKIIVRELIELRAGIAAGFRLKAFGVSGRDETQFTIQNAEQIVEVTGPVLITRGFQ